LIKPSNLVLDFDTGVYRLAALKKAAYKFGDRCFIHIETTDDHRIRVTLQPKRVIDNLDHLSGEFQNEVLDQELREAVAQETEGIRNLLLAQAFSATSLLDPVGEIADDEVDPLNIRPSDQQNRERQLDSAKPESESQSK
jgi:His-Xaa-Ser system protein HxsD